MHNSPLAERMRPRHIDEFLGQRHLIGPGKLLTGLLERGKLPSIILWGPPGCGKTTLARLLSSVAGMHFVAFSAVLSGVKELRSIVEEARERAEKGIGTTLFVDEIHRFNKAQQDAFLPHVESGLITLIGATTENPSFEVIAPLLSRCRVLTLQPMEPADLHILLDRALTDTERGLGKLGLTITSQAAGYLVAASDGDARHLLNSLEVAAELALSGNTKEIGMELLKEAMQQKALRYDKSGEEHYNLISALHKSLRGSDPDAALYWLARMLASGEDPHYIARRMIRFASEDIGNADPNALTLAISGLQAFDFLGSPEGELALAQVAVYLATAPKSNAVYAAFGEAMADAKRFGALAVPLHLRNAPTRLMKELGYGEGYQYAHDMEDAVVTQDHLPRELRERIYYRPTARGHELVIKERLEKWRRIQAQRKAIHR
jgi:putative ATPase